LQKSRDAGLTFYISAGRVHEYADAPRALRLLRARDKWPSCHRAANKPDELATFH
jgi:hypothetical protein